MSTVKIIRTEFGCKGKRWVCQVFLSGLLLSIGLWGEGVAYAATESPRLPLGRLLLSPAARAELVQYRLHTAAAVSGQMLRLDGVIKRSDGRRFFWLNGQLQETLPPARLRVGETMNRANGEKRDAVPAGALGIDGPRDHAP